METTEPAVSSADIIIRITVPMKMPINPSANNNKIKAGVVAGMGGTLEARNGVSKKAKGEGKGKAHLSADKAVANPGHQHQGRAEPHKDQQKRKHMRNDNVL